jgi:hypothetical protein
MFYSREQTKGNKFWASKLFGAFFPHAVPSLTQVRHHKNTVVNRTPFIVDNDSEIVTSGIIWQNFLRDIWGGSNNRSLRRWIEDAEPRVILVRQALRESWRSVASGSAPVLAATILTAFNDNAAITYLASLVPGFSDALKYVVMAGTSGRCNCGVPVSPDGLSLASQMTRRQEHSPSASRESFVGTHESTEVLGVAEECSWGIVWHRRGAGHMQNAGGVGKGHQTNSGFSARRTTHRFVDKVRPNEFNTGAFGTFVTGLESGANAGKHAWGGGLDSTYPKSGNGGNRNDASDSASD